MAYWDSTAKLFRILGDYTNTYNLLIFPETLATGVSVRTTLQYRVVIPNGNGPGVDRYIPYPDRSGYADFTDISILNTTMVHNAIILPISSTADLRANGFYIQFKLSTALTVGKCDLTYCYALVQSLQ